MATPPKINNRDQRIGGGSKLKERVEAYAHVKQDARIEAVHDALMYSIDRIIEDNPKASFNPSQVNVIRDVAFQLVHLLLPISDKPKGLIAGCVQQYKESEPFGKAKAIAAVVAAVVAVGTTLWTGYNQASSLWAAQPKQNIPVPNARAVPTPLATPPISAAPDAGHNPSQALSGGRDKAVQK